MDIHFSLIYLFTFVGADYLFIYLKYIFRSLKKILRIQLIYVKNCRAYTNNFF